ncbi:MAG: polysaccharide deacetylase family protein [Phycisphaerae bacterium]
MNPRPDTQFARRYAQLRRPVPLLSRRGVWIVVRNLGLNVIGRLLPAGTKPFVRCLYLHYAYDDQTAELRRLLAHLLGLGSFISTPHLVDILTGRRPLDGRYFHLSIDDAFDNIYRNAFPMLRELEIPAIVFVPTRLVEMPDEEFLTYWWVTYLKLPTRLMTWREIREMSEAGFEFGSHTETHVRLPTIAGDRARLERELRRSKQTLEDRLGRPCRYFAPPFGKNGDVNEPVQAAIREAGYEASFSAVRGGLRPGVTSPYFIPRQHFEPDWPWPHVRYFALGGGEER